MKLNFLSAGHKYLQKHLHLFLALSIGLCVLIPLFQPGLPVTDDLIHLGIRASAFHQSFVDGHFPVRWLDRLYENYGYPVSNFLYPLPFYLLEPFLILGFPIATGLKTLLVIATLTTISGLYFWLKPRFGSLPAFVGSAVYSLGTYQITNLYQRGSLGEIIAFAFVPWIFIFIDKFSRSKTTIHQVLAATAIALLITSHNVQALIFVPIFCGYFVVSMLEKKQGLLKTLVQLFLTLTLALSMSLYFWLPAINDLRHTVNSQIQISKLEDYFQDPVNLLLSIGLVSLLSLFISIFSEKKQLGRFWILVFSFMVFMQLPITRGIWQIFSFDKYLQFPFRLLGLLMIASSFLTASVFKLVRFKRKPRLFLAIIIVLVSLIQVFPQIQKISFQEINDSYFFTNFGTSTTQNEFTPIWVKNPPATYSQQEIEIVGNPDTYQVNDQTTKTQEKFIQISLNENLVVNFNTHYFPGWQLYLDDNPVKPTIKNNGTISVELTVPQRSDKKRDLRLVWEETPLRKISNHISLVAWLLVLAFLTFSRTRNLTKTTAYLSVVILVTNLGISLLQNHKLFTKNFDPIQMEQKYLNSQWVNPDSKAPLGDHGLYAWAGWQYVHGQNPILINSEMPPLGKYLIGIGLVTLKKPALVGLFFSMTFLISFYLLSLMVIKNRWLSIIPLTLLSTQPIFQSLLTVTMLDSIQLTFLCLSFFFVLRAHSCWRWLVPAMLALGGVLSSKFYATGLLVIASLIFYLAVSKNYKLLFRFAVFLPLAFLVHVASYFQFFLLANSFRNYLGVQKYIFDFYRQGAPSVPFGSYWKLVFLNQWRVWWGPEWGIYYTLKAKEWNLLWPIAGITSLISIYQFIADSLKKWIKKPLLLSLRARLAMQDSREAKSPKKVTKKPTKKSIPSHHLLTSWLMFYSLFLTTIGGWPHYMLLFLPFAFILLTRFISIKLKLTTSPSS